jgi:hypothetical protein
MEDWSSNNVLLSPIQKSCGSGGQQETCIQMMFYCKLRDEWLAEKDLPLLTIITC